MVVMAEPKDQLKQITKAKTRTRIQDKDMYERRKLK